MTSLAAFLKTHWWLLPLGLTALCFTGEARGALRRRARAYHRPGESALDILEKRYTSGEIGPIEYGEKILTMGFGKRGQGTGRT